MGSTPAEAAARVVRCSFSVTPCGSLKALHAGASRRSMRTGVRAAGRFEPPASQPDGSQRSPACGWHADPVSELLHRIEEASTPLVEPLPRSLELLPRI